MLKLAIYAVIALAVIGVLYWVADVLVVEPLVAKGMAQQAKVDKPIIDDLNSRVATALAANAACTSSLNEIRQAAAQSDAKWKEMNAAVEKAQVSARAEIARIQKSADAAETARLTAIATTVPVNETQAQECEDARQILSDLARARRLRQ